MDGILNVFQSPQWGSNSKAELTGEEEEIEVVSVPAMGK